MRSPEEQALSAALKDSTASVGFDDVMLARAVSGGRRRRARGRTAAATLVTGVVVVAGGAVVQYWDRRGEDSGTIAAPGPDASPSRSEADLAEAFATTRSVVEPLLAVNDSRYEQEQFALALNHETGDAILYLPYTGTIGVGGAGVIDVERLAAEAVAAVRATPGAAPVVPVVGVALSDELDVVASRLFDSRAEWASSPNDVYWTDARPEDVSIMIGVAEPEVAADLPGTVQLASGATATIRTQKSGPIVEE